MNSQSHILMGALLFGRQVPRAAIAGAVGGFLPDVPMLAIVLGLKLSGVSDPVIFGQMYWEPWWQASNAIGHSFLLWGGLVLVSLGMRRIGNSSIWPLGLALAGAALLHSIIDFLAHREDAHMHFWPLSSWKFMSPVSYWDPAHFGGVFGLLESVLGIVMAVLLFRRYRSIIVRGLLGLAVLAYAAVPVYFMAH